MTALFLYQLICELGQCIELAKSHVSLYSYMYYVVQVCFITVLSKNKLPDSVFLASGALCFRIRLSVFIRIVGPGFFILHKLGLYY